MFQYAISLDTFVAGMNNLVLLNKFTMIEISILSSLWY